MQQPLLKHKAKEKSPAGLFLFVIDHQGPGDYEGHDRHYHLTVLSDVAFGTDGHLPEHAVFTDDRQQILDIIIAHPVEMEDHEIGLLLRTEYTETHGNGIRQKRDQMKNVSKAVKYDDRLRGCAFLLGRIAVQQIVRKFLPRAGDRVEHPVNGIMD